MKDNSTAEFQARWEAAYRYASEHSPFYREVFRNQKGVPRLSNVPTVDKSTLSRRNLDFLCVPRERVVEIVTTSGTTGQPLQWMLAEADLQRLALCESRAFAGVGLIAADTVLIAVTLDRCFVAGMAYALGLRKLGCTALRVGPSSPLFALKALQLALGVPPGHRQEQRATQDLANDSARQGAGGTFAPTAIVGVPSFLRLVANKAHDLGIDLRTCSVRKVICIGEPVRTFEGAPGVPPGSSAPVPASFPLNSAGQAVESSWGARVYSTYGVTELSGSCCECAAGMGAHVQTDLMHVEILDDAGRAVPDGVVGEIVATTFGVEAMPLVRFRTGDCAAMFSEPCPCGRASPRLGPVVGRKQQKLKIKGTSVFPLALQAILDEAAVGAYVIIATAENELSDQIEVLYHGDAKPEALREVFQARVKIAPHIRLASLEEIEALQMPPHARKRQLFVDRRGGRNS